MERSPILGTRGSPLALAQARKVASALEVAQRWPAGFIHIAAITTSGDTIQDRPLAEVGGKFLWTKELDRALIDGETDFSVHSLKDVESERPKSIRLCAVRPRADVRERLIGAESIDALKQGAVVGTSSPRRAAQLLSLRPDLKIVTLRGNVDTRLAKVAAGEVDATLLAAAGLKRLGKHDVGTPVPVSVLLPAPTQGVIGIECRADDAMTAAVLRAVDDETTHAAIRAERAFTLALGASCHSPVAALATMEKGRLYFRAQLLSEDGRETIRDEARFECGDLAGPKALAKAMLKRAPEAIRRLFEG
ncbi:hydroxymethylbilane synthase [Sphingomonas sp.]|uniref:hydroxymethylbilane synthase n=1 Tax=Sphingomonas sp. TaxID=28214 RepID=UPI00286E16D5|nr:hydroxymethylbilane synthase [Sphingomonas sp.]